MTARRRPPEQVVLRVSLLASLILAAVAVAWGLTAGAQIILLDGLYLMLGSALSAISLAAARRAAADPTPQYPFGRESLIPLAVGIQGLALLATCGYAALDAIRAILAGGTDIAVGSVAAYALVSAAAAVAMHAYVRRSDGGSDLLDAEARQWRAGALLSVVVLVGALLVLALRGSRWGDAQRYVDPVLVLVACVLLIPEPVRMVRTMTVELLEGAPDDDILRPVRLAVEQIRAEHGLGPTTSRVGKVGSKLYVEVTFVAAPGHWDITDEDRVRHALAGRLAPLPFDVWLNVELTPGKLTG